MTDGLIVFARLDSRRLPGKSLADVAGRSLLGRVVDRARRIDSLPIVIATSDRPVDDPIAEFARAETLALYRGSVDDVAGRALGAARASGFERFARICGDRPFHDWRLTAAMLRRARVAKLDIATNTLSKTWPPGMAAEIVRTQALAAARPRFDDAGIEHVTDWFYRHPEGWRIEDFPAPPDCRRPTRLAVDTSRDLERAVHVAAGLGARSAEAESAEVIGLAEAWDRRHPE